MKVSRKRPTAQIAHPGHPEVVFTLQKPDAFDVAELALLFRRYERHDPVFDFDGKPVMVERGGVFEVATTSRPDVPPDAVLRACVRYVADLEGLEDLDTGEKIVYRGSTDEKMAVLRVLATDDFLIHLSIPRPSNVRGMKGPDGKELPPQTLQSVYDWIIEKGNNPETFGISLGKG